MKKTEVKQWLDQMGWSFPNMSDEQKLEMRKALGICGAATASSKYTFPCSFTPMQNGRCKAHGGKSKMGIASATHKTGRHSKYLPQNLVGKYNAAQQDPDLLNLSSEIQLLDSRLAQLLERADTGGGISNWVDLNRAWRGMLTAQRRGDENQVAELVRNINDIVNRGLHDSMVWEDIGRLIDRRQRLVSTEAKRRVDLEVMINVDKVVTFMLKTGDIIRERLTRYMIEKKPVDKYLLSEITTDIANSITLDEK